MVDLEGSNCRDDFPRNCAKANDRGTRQAQKEIGHVSMLAILSYL